MRPIISERIARWMFLLQEYKFEIVYMPGESHISRIDNGEPPTGLDDQLLDVDLFNMEVQKEDLMREKGKSSGKNIVNKGNKTLCLEWHMVYVQPKEDWGGIF